jgi:hypothetical protein
MTYLDLVNNVLRRMREEEVSSVQSTTYSKMVGDFVNDAKKIVEAAWDWSALRTTLTITTTADIFNYVLTGSQNRIKALNVINDTDNIFMEYRPATWFDDKYLNQDPVSGSPEYYTYNGVDSSGDSQIDVYPKPDGVYTIRFNCIFRNDDLSADVDTLLIPSMPVIHLAIALLARERGETGGTSAPEYFGIADKYLSDAIALDAQKHPDETIWYTP